MRRGTLLCWLCLLGAGCREAPRYRVVVHVPGQAARATRVDVWVVPSCAGVGTLGAEPPSSVAHTVIAGGVGDGLGDVATGKYGLYAVAWDACVAFAAGCDPIDVGADGGALDVVLNGIEEHGCAAGEECVNDACAGADGGPDDDAYEREVLADLPLGYWRFDDVATPVARDATGNGNDGIYSSDVVLGVPGALRSGDTAARFDGEDDVLTIGDRFGFEENAAFTLEVWLRPGDDYDGAVCGKVMYLAVDDSYDGYGLVLHVDGGTVTFYRSTHGQVDGPRPSSGIFHHLVVTYDGALLSLFIDGILAATAQDPGSMPATPAPFQVAAGAQWSSLAADFDELAVYDHALASQRVEEHFAAARRE